MRNDGLIITDRPYKLGGKIEWLEGDDVWKLEVVGQPDIVAVLIGGDDIRNVTETDSRNPSLLEALIKDHADDIEEMIAIAEIEHWEPEMGIIPLCAVPQGVEPPN